MAKNRLPKRLYARIAKDGDVSYFIADDNPAALVEMGERIMIGIYQLVEMTSAEGVLSMGKPPR